MQLARDGRAANVVILFEYDDIQPGLRQVRGVRQAIVAGTDNDGIVTTHLSTSCAAL